MIPGVGGHPKNVLFLTADAFGVLPPIAKLTPEQAMYHFLRVTPRSSPEPKPASARSLCRVLDLLRIAVHAACRRRFMPRCSAGACVTRAQCWLVNTGWQGGQYGVENAWI